MRLEIIFGGEIMYVKVVRAFLLIGMVCILCSVAVGQDVPDDPNHLPKKIGGEPSSINRLDAITVTGKVTLTGLSPDVPRPKVSIAVYTYGRLVVRRNVPDNGSFSISDVPREGASIILEIDQSEVETRQILPGPGMTMFQDFRIDMARVPQARNRPGVISAAQAYSRSPERQRLYEKASADLSANKLNDALNFFKELVTADQADYFAWTQLGNAYFLKNEYKDAENSYSKAISLKPDHVQAMINLGKLFLAQQRSDAAIETLFKAVMAEPLSADAQQYLGEAYLMAKKGSKAVTYLNEAIRLAPVEKAEVHLRLAALYNAAGLKSRASAEYKMYLEKVPGSDRRKDLEKYITENPPEK